MQCIFIKGVFYLTPVHAFATIRGKAGKPCLLTGSSMQP